MSDIWLPDHLRHARTSIRYLDSTGISRNAFNGSLVTASKGGDKLALTLQFTPHGGNSASGKSERALLRSFLAQLRGRQNRAYIQDLSYRRRGNFPTGELLANNTFADGTTGWSAIDATSTLAAADRVLVSRTVTGAGIPFISKQVTGLTQYAPYVARAHITSGRDSGTTFSGKAYLGSTSGNNDYSSTSVALNGGALVTTAAVVPATSAYFGAGDTSLAGHLAGDYLTFRYVSMARCALVDNGANMLLRSDEFNSASWSNTRTTDASNSTAAPDGATSADSIIEDATASNTHQIGQVVTVASGAADYSFSVALKAGTRTWARLQVFENTGSSLAAAYFNLSTGAVGTVTTGANWASVRAVSRDLGNGWYLCNVVGRKTNAATGLTATIGLATGNGADSYSGDGASLIYAWRATLSQSSAPSRLVATTSAAVLPTAQVGSGLHLEGLPASTAGLLEIDDRVEIVTSRGSEFKIVTSRLDSDAAGLGYLQFEPPIRFAPDDGAPVIVHQPYGKFLFTGDAVGWENDPGGWSNGSAEFEEAI